MPSSCPNCSKCLLANAVRCSECGWTPKNETFYGNHGNTIVAIIPCGVHPLHDVKVLASGARRGCPMCEMQGR